MPAGRLSPMPSRAYSREWKAVGFFPRYCYHLNRETLCLDCALAFPNGPVRNNCRSTGVVAQKVPASQVRQSRVGLETCQQIAQDEASPAPAKIPRPALRLPEGNSILNSREQNRTTSLDHLPRINQPGEVEANNVHLSLAN